MDPPPTLPSLWQRPDINVGLRYTSDLIDDLVDLAANSPNHALKAQHLLSTGIQILVSIQQYLSSGSEDFLNAIRTIQSLQVTESVLRESIGLLSEDVGDGDVPPLDRAVLAGWHFNRNTFSKQLKTLSGVGSEVHPQEDQWTTVMRDVVRADDFNWATELVDQTVPMISDDGTKGSLQTILSKLNDDESSEDDEMIQTDSILAIMCLADEAHRSPDDIDGNVVSVVNDMAEELGKTEGHDWGALSRRLHALPVCRQVEKPLLVHQGAYPIPYIVDDAQKEIDYAGSQIAAITVFVESIEEANMDEVKRHLGDVEIAMKGAAGHLKALASKGHESVKGDKDGRSISYDAVRLLTATALAITPVCDLQEIPAFKDSLDDIVDSAHNFIDALGAFELLPNWKTALGRALVHMETMLKRFRTPSIAVDGRRNPDFEDQRRSGPSNFSGSSTPTPEGSGGKGDKQGTREMVADLASTMAHTVKEKLRVGKTG